MPTRAVAPLIATALTVLASRPAEAHAFLRRYDLPLPLWHYLLAAGLAVAFTFVLLGFLRSERAAPLAGVDLSGTALDRLLMNRVFKLALAVISTVLFAVLLAAGFLGAQEDPFRNILPVFVWVLWWVGFAFFCALVGNAWPAVNPLGIIGRSLERLTRRPPRPLPPGIGVWPAVVLYFGFAWAELVWPDNAHPASLARAILSYSVITWIAMAIYGSERWLRCGETFSLLFELFGRFAPFGRKPDGRLVLRLYGIGLLATEKVSPSMMVFILALLATVSFDGFLHTLPWRKIFGAAFTASYDLGLIDLLGNTGARTLIVTAGLLAAPVIFFAVFIGVCAWTAVLTAGAHAARQHTLSFAGRYAPTLVPIAIAYHLAHYLSLLLIEGQRIFALISDPFGLGWNLFGTAGTMPDLAIIDARFLWLFSVVAIVAGHVIAVVLAHFITLQVCDDRKKALVSEMPMLVLMIGYTILSLWILAQPIVEA
jgi:hypothetical protein